MKKPSLTAVTSFLMAVCITFYASPVKAQQNVVKINFLSLVISTFNVSYERVINEEKSFQLGVYYTGVKVSSTKFSGFGITPEYRFYLSETEAPDGVYIAPFLRYNNLNLKDELTINEASLTSFGGGIIMGRHWIFKEKISLDLFIGPSYLIASVEDLTGTGIYDTGAFDGFTLRFGVTMGLGF